MTPDIATAKAKLSIPLYTCDFDPQDPSLLVVGGGGGASKTGVGNRITVLDASKSQKLTVLTENELSNDEDNPTSLAVGLDHLIYVGINSSPRDIKDGRNQHFRILHLQCTSEETDNGENVKPVRYKISEKSRCTLFSGKEKDIYQRVTRLARGFTGYGSQLGVVTTGLAHEHEIIIFETAGSNPPITLDILHIEKEALDVDLIQSSQRDFQLAYCDEHKIYTKSVALKKDEEKLECRYFVSSSGNSQKSKIPSLRAIRWLTRNHIVVLTNLHGNMGVSVSIITFEIKKSGNSQVIQSIHLPRRCSKATGLCVTNLAPSKTSIEAQEPTQYVIAVAGHDCSLHLLVVDMSIEGGVPSFSTITLFRSFQCVHPLQITSIAFSSFRPSDNPKNSNLAPLSLRLVSVGISNTVVVHTIPVFSTLPITQRNQSNILHYRIVSTSKAKTKGLFATIGIMGILLIAILVQVVRDTNGNFPNHLHIRNRIPQNWQDTLGFHLSPIIKTVTFRKKTEAVMVNLISTRTGNYKATVPLTIPIKEYLSKITDIGFHEFNDIVVLNEEDGELKAFVYKDCASDVDDFRIGLSGTKWANLSEKQKDLWVSRFRDLGKSMEDLPETKLQGILFQELAEV